VAVYVNNNIIKILKHTVLNIHQHT